MGYVPHTSPPLGTRSIYDDVLILIILDATGIKDFFLFWSIGFHFVASLGLFVVCKLSYRLFFEWKVKNGQAIIIGEFRDDKQQAFL